MRGNLTGECEDDPGTHWVSKSRKDELSLSFLRKTDVFWGKNEDYYKKRGRPCFAYSNKRNSQKWLIAISIFCRFPWLSSCGTRDRHRPLLVVFAVISVEVHETFWREQIPLARMPRAVGVKHCHETWFNGGIKIIYTECMPVFHS